MCGIAGIFARDDGGAVDRMVHAMTHRGPDDCGVARLGRTVLGHTRLSIIDPSSAGHQPMRSACGNVHITFNGEIYNYREEREHLVAKGHTFTSTSDTEVVLEAYLEYGDAFVSRLRGIFAFAIHDRRGNAPDGRLILARDHLGVKPLVYARQGGSLVFASELKAMLASGLVDKRIDRQALRTLLTFGSVFQPMTLLEGVRSLPAGHMLIAAGGDVSLTRYWTLASDRRPELRAMPYEAQCRLLRETLEETIQSQLVSDVPIGAFLSGGVDSSLIVAIMAARAGGRVRTFSVGFEHTDAQPDESAEAAHMARWLGVENDRVLITDADVLENLEAFVVGLDQPSVDGLNAYFVSRWTARSVKVALSGTGSDELFAGYPWFAMLEQQFGQNVPAAARPRAGPVRRVVSALRRMRNALTDNPYAPVASASSVPFLEAYGRAYHCYPPAVVHTLMGEPMPSGAERPTDFGPDLSPYDILPDAPPVDRLTPVCLSAYTGNQLLRDIDACSMASSLEVRVPFLDPVVADVALSMDTTSKLRLSPHTLDPTAGYESSGVKRALVDVARAYLPSEYFSERPKRGFGLPHANWLRGPLAPAMRDALSAETIRRRGLLDPDAVQDVVAQFDAGRAPWSQPWVLMVLEMWCALVLDPG